MKNALIIYSSKIPSVEIVCNLFETIHQKGDIEIIEKTVMDCRARDIEWSDIVLAIRPFEISASRIVNAAKRANKELVVYLDDDLLHLPHVYSSRLRGFFTSLFYTRNCGYLKNALSICDILWGSSKFLINQYSRYVLKGRCVCTDIGVDFGRPKPAHRNQDEINIFFAGSGNHHKELNEYVIPAINALVPEFSNIKLTCIGIRKDYLANCLAKTEIMPWINDYKDYYSYIMGKSFDIGVAPIGQDDFYRCKYYNKYIEYTVMGIVGIYSNDHPYTDVITDGINGLLANNSVSSWTEKIRYAIENPEISKEMVVKAQIDYEYRFTRTSQIAMVKEKMPEFFKSEHREYGKVRFRPNYILDCARKYANRLVIAYERFR